jgi:hypothetical protein
MPTYLISFPAMAITVAAEELAAVGDAAHAVVRDAKAAGVYRFSGGIDGSTTPVRIAADGAVTPGGYPETSGLNGGFCILELPSRAEAVAWAARLAAACRCPQELREFGDDPER